MAGVVASVGWAHRVDLQIGHYCVWPRLVALGHDNFAPVSVAEIIKDHSFIAIPKDELQLVGSVRYNTGNIYWRPNWNGQIGRAQDVHLGF